MNFSIGVLLTIILFASLPTPSSPRQSAIVPDSGYVGVEGGKLFYEMAGQGKTIVLVHDGLLHRETWDNQFLVFARNFKVVRYDRRGYGKSPKPEKPFSNIEDLRQLFEALKIDKATLIGMSGGGGLTLQFALQYPDKVESLVLVGAVVPGLPFTEHFQTRGGRMKASDTATPRALIEYFMKDPYIIYAGNQEARQKAQRLLEANPQNLLPNPYALPPERLALKYLNEIRVPTLIVVGEYDIPDVHAHAGAIAAGIPNSKRVILSNAGHLVPLEQPEAFNRLVLDFLKF